MPSKTRKASRDFIQHHHLLMRMELKKCPKKKDVPRVKDMVTGILDALNMHMLDKPRVYYLDTPKNNRGMTCIAPIKTSHIAFHFWDDPDKSILHNPDSHCLLEFDIYTCGSMSPSAVKNILHELAPFEPTRAEIDILNRRHELKLEHHFHWDSKKSQVWDAWLESRQFLNTSRNRNRTRRH
jgi:S-adenosylmethionine/arginine decarboxylase-like enzyme